jgi:hypothetical protein
MRLLLTAVTALVVLSVACGLEAPGAVVEDPGCLKDADCKAPRICVIPFGETAGSCENPEAPGLGGSGGTGHGGSGGSGGAGGTGGAGGSGGTGGGSDCAAACKVVAPCLMLDVGDCLLLCDQFTPKCRTCVVAACDAGQQDPFAACATSCI